MQLQPFGVEEPGQGVVAWLEHRGIGGEFSLRYQRGPATFGRMTLMLVAVTIAACAWPRRAASVDPVEVLRQE